MALQSSLPKNDEGPAFELESMFRWGQGSIDIGTEAQELPEDKCLRHRRTRAPTNRNW